MLFSPSAGVWPSSLFCKLAVHLSFHLVFRGGGGGQGPSALILWCFSLDRGCAALCQGARWGSGSAGFSVCLVFPEGFPRLLPLERVRIKGPPASVGREV